MSRRLTVRGARQHNLRAVDVDLPRDALTVITGPSGSGKSSLAFDTIYAEGQRRYVESLSTYARQFLDQLPKPDVDLIEGLSPSIAIQQGTVSRNPRSTVGTVTEIYDYLRVLMARVGEPHCPTCDRPIRAYTVPQMVARVFALGEGARVMIHAPLGRDEVGDLGSRLEELRRDGYVRVVLDGETRELADLEAPDPSVPHDLEVQVDRLVVRDRARPRLGESLELATRLAGGAVRVVVQGAEDLVMQEGLACPEHGPVLESLSPQTFSFNSPHGACPGCDGLGEQTRFDPDRVVPDPDLSIADGAIAPWGKPGAPYHRAMSRQLESALTGKLAVKLDTPWKRLRKAARARVLDGEGAWEGVLPILERRAKDHHQRRLEQGSDAEAAGYLEEELERYAVRQTCAVCGGARLRPEALAVRLGAHNIDALTRMSIREATEAFGAVALEGARLEIGARLLREVRSRLAFLDDVGLGYLSLDRRARTLSGGEAQRIRLATQIGAALVGVLYVLDEPSIGLHARDNERLLGTLLRLRDAGNTVVVVEHDPATWRAADHLVDMGPGAGRLGGQVVAAGTPQEVAQVEASSTGRYLAGQRPSLAGRRRREPSGWLTVADARTHNLRGVTARVPLGALTCVSGVSGSGKSSLVSDTLLPLARAALHRAKVGDVAGRLEGLEALDKVVSIDQAPIGRTPRSNPATYSGLFTTLRELFASLPEARARGYSAGRFSFNVKGGRCEVCKGDGVLRVSMHFLPDVFVTCEECAGRRYEAETLAIRYRGLSIADVLDLTIEEALELLSAIPKLQIGLKALTSVGLGYVSLGQSATTLSGGEAQRLKLAKELARRDTGQTLYVLDEPTTGLHYTDVVVLMDALETLVDQGNTVLVVEHDLDVLARADHVIDLGPEGGDGGGEIVAAGTPEEVAAEPRSHTGRYLASRLGC